MKTKKEILLENGYSCINGYVLDYEKSEQENVIISREDVERFFYESPSEFFFEEHDDWAVDLDSAWESFVDNYLCSMDIEELDDEDIIKIFSGDKNE